MSKIKDNFGNELELDDIAARVKDPIAFAQKLIEVAKKARVGGKLTVEVDPDGNFNIFHDGEVV